MVTGSSRRRPFPSGAARVARFLGGLPRGRRLALTSCSFLIPLTLWAAVSYVPSSGIR